MKRVQRWLVWVLFCLLPIPILSLAAPQPASAQGRTGLVLAHYYAWFDPSSFDAGKTPFTNPSPYFSTDRGVIQRHVDQARAAGIDGFVQAWYGPDAGQQTEPNFKTLLDVASGSGFKAAVTFEPVSGFMPNNDVRASSLQTLLATHAQHPAYLRMDGKPVIFFWANWALSVADWEYIRSIADPNRTSIWIAEGGNMNYIGVFDGMYLYNIAWSPDPGGINLRWGGETRAATQQYSSYKYWAATAMPGFNDSLLGRGSNTIVRDRSDGAYYRNSFSGAAQSAPDLLVITSFNEWPEGSNIEPSNEFGDFYLNLTQELVSTYKSGGIPAAAAVPPSNPQPTTAAATNENGGESGGSQTVAQQPQGTPLPTNTPFPTATPQPTRTPYPDGRIVHIVQTGETITTIAIDYGLTFDEFFALNPTLNLQSLISVGQEVTIGLDSRTVSAAATAAARLSPTPTATPSVLDGYPNTTVRDADGAIIYEVREGNTLIEIALLYNLTMAEIYELNGLNETSLIGVGDPIIVGYVPTPEGDAVGGSADLPEEPPTETATPMPTATATSTTPPPTATAEPAVTTPAGSPTPIPTVAPADGGSSLISSYFLAILFVVVGALALLGALLIFLSRRV